MIAGVLALSLSSLWFMSRVYRHGVLSVQVRMHIGTRLVRSQGISVATVIGFVGVSARILVCPLRIGTAVISFVGHGRLGAQVTM